MPTTTQQLIWIYSDSPVAAEEIKTIKEINPDGWFITLDKNLIDPHWCCRVTDWEEYNGGFALFSQETGELVAEKNIKKYLLQQQGWTSEVLISMALSPLRTDLVKQWLKANSGNLVESREVRDGREWRIIKKSDETISVSLTTNCRQQNPDSAVEPLPEEEKERLHYLESLIEASFVIVGKSLKEIRDSRLYRETHINFDSYCRDRWKFSKDKAKNLIDSSEVYETISVSLTTNCRQQNPHSTVEPLPAKRLDEVEIPLPKTESQLRPIARANLSPEQQVEAWELAVYQNDMKVPTQKIVKQVVKEMLEGKPKNPWKRGDVCQYVGVTGKAGLWCVVNDVGEFSCTVEDYREQEVQVRPDEIKSLELPAEQEEFMRALLPRLQALSETEDAIALHTLLFFGRLNRGYLSDSEEAILRTLEAKN